jgi:hypothetical protein
MLVLPFTEIVMEVIRANQQFEQRRMIAKLLPLLGSLRLPLTDEKKLQSLLSTALSAAHVDHTREVKLAPGSIVDFMLDHGIVIECKLKEGKREIFRQLQRYAEFDEVQCLILMTNTSMGLPEEINGKSTYYCSLGKAWI